MRKSDGEEWLIPTVMALYCGARIGAGDTRSFEVK